MARNGGPSRPRQCPPRQPGNEDDARLRDLAQAPKHLRSAGDRPESTTVPHERAYLSRLANSVVATHREGHMTLVIVNQVKRAQGLYKEVRKILNSRADRVPELVLLHSRFRPADREREMGKLAGANAEPDIIAIATQAVEAGVDISAAVMFTELAPWASMVQRFGRANRRAEVEGGAQVHWIDILGSAEGDDRKAQQQAAHLGAALRSRRIDQGSRQARILGRCGSCTPSSGWGHRSSVARRATKGPRRSLRHGCRPDRLRRRHISVHSRCRRHRRPGLLAGIAGVW